MTIDPRLKTKLETAASIATLAALASAGGLLAGGLPTTEAGWRSVLGTAFAAAVLAEVAWVRTLLKGALVVDTATTVEQTVTSAVGK